MVREQRVSEYGRKSLRNQQESEVRRDEIWMEKGRVEEVEGYEEDRF